MKKILKPTLFVAGFTALLIISCKEKNNNSITPTYRTESTGTGANPNIKTVKTAGQNVDNKDLKTPQEQR